MISIIDSYLTLEPAFLTVAPVVTAVACILAGNLRASPELDSCSLLRCAEVDFCGCFAGNIFTFVLVGDASLK